MILLSGAPLAREDKGRILSFPPSISFLLLWDGKSREAKRYLRSIERFLKEVNLPFFEEVASCEEGVQHLPKDLFSTCSTALIKPVDPAVETRLRSLLHPALDPDVLTEENRGRMPQGGILPAVAEASLRLLDGYGISLAGKRALVIGRSPSVGLPVALGLLRKDASVAIAHSKTSQESLFSYARESEVVILASGRRGILPKRCFRKGAVVLDLGCADGRGGALGFDPPEDLFSAYAPIPGGVGPLTVSSLVINAMKLRGLWNG